MKNKLFKRIILIFIILISIVVFNSANSYASASFTATPSTSTINIGETITLTITAIDCAGKFSINSSDTSIVSSNETEKFIDEKAETITLTAKKAGNVTITITATDVGDKQPESKEVTGSKTVSITVKEKEPEKPVETEKPVEPEKPKEPNFTVSNETVYAKNQTNVRESYTTSSKSLGMLAVGDSVARIGIGDNGWSKVTYNNKTAYIYTNNLTTTKPEQPKSTDKSLKSLSITEGTLAPEFTPETTKYSVEVPNNVTTATINAIANDEKAKVAITGNQDLKTGSNLLKVTVTAEDGTTRIYNIEVIKTQADPIRLTKLEIPGITFDPEFNPEVYSYKIELGEKSTVTDFAIQTATNREDVTVEIIGNSNFKEGENIITILISAKEGMEKISYQIIVNKPAVVAQTNMFSGEQGKTNIALIAIGTLLVIGIIVVVVAIIKKRQNDQEDDYDDDDDDDTDRRSPYKISFEEDLDTEEDAKKEDFTGVYKNQIMNEDEMERQTGKFDTTSIQNEKYTQDTKPEESEMTRKFSTNYDYTLETYKKSKNGGLGKGRHF